MSKEFEEIVLQKLSKIDEIEQKLSKIDEIEQKVSKIDEIEQKVSKIDEIEKKVSEIDTIKETLEVVKKSVIIIEDKVNRELPALFEAYDLNYVIQKEKEKKIDSLENISNNLSYRVDSLENTVKEHSIELKKLIS